MPTVASKPPGSGARILVIDDLRTFAFPARYARTSAEAFAAFGELTELEGYDEVWFDHDLGPGDDINAVVRHLEERAYFDDPIPIGLAVVHSANPVGADRTASTLGRWYRTVRVDAAGYLKN